MNSFPVILDSIPSLVTRGAGEATVALPVFHYLSYSLLGLREWNIVIFSSLAAACRLCLTIIGSFNTAYGYFSLFNNKTGNHNVALGFNAGNYQAYNNYNTFIGYFSNGAAGITNATAIGANAVVNASNKIRLGNAAVTVVEGEVPYTFTSDATKKENFRPVNGEEVLSKIGKFNLPSWNYIGHDPQEFRHYGPMAQEFFAAFGQDEVGTIGTPTTINSGDMAGILMIAVQALEKRSKELQAENELLRTGLEALEKSLTK